VLNHFLSSARGCVVVAGKSAVSDPSQVGGSGIRGSGPLLVLPPDGASLGA
jgi:hypothetical protein